MCTFAVQLLESVRTNGKLRFYKMLKDGKAPFDSFYEEVCDDKRLKKDMLQILAMMDFMAETNKILPREKVNSIKDGDKVIGIEFKKNDLRVYCLKQDPNVFVVMGGYKKDQDNDIKDMKRLLKTNKGLLEVLQQATTNCVE